MNTTWKASRRRRLAMWLRGYRTEAHGTYHVWTRTYHDRTFQRLLGQLDHVANKAPVALAALAIAIAGLTWALTR